MTAIPENKTFETGTQPFPSLVHLGVPCGLCHSADNENAAPLSTGAFIPQSSVGAGRPHQACAAAAARCGTSSFLGSIVPRLSMWLCVHGCTAADVLQASL